MNQKLKKSSKPKTLSRKKGANIPARFRGYILNVRSRHPSHTRLKRAGIRLGFRTAVRLGSTWAGDGKPRVECNTVDAVRVSANKQLMKRVFHTQHVKTALWLDGSATQEARNTWLGQVGFPIVAKHIYGSRGTGNYLLKTQAEFTAWLQGKNLNNYIFEKFYDYNREYRLHVTHDGCFYACRKMLKQDTPEDKRWFRNDSNSVWITQFDATGNLKADFDQPRNWDAIVAEAVKALKAVGLDIGAIDVRVQSARNKDNQVRPNPEFIILETNSAPSFGDITYEKYKEIIPEILKKKRNEVH